MTMQAMCDYLSARGFVVRKRYDSTTKAYVFDVGRGGQILHQYFKYPVDVNPVTRDRIQREFLDDIIKQFNWVELREIDIINELNRLPAGDIIRQTIENIEKGEKMRNNGIKWKVQEVTSQTDTDGFAFYAHLVGTPDGIFVGDMRGVKDNLQERVNGEIQWDLYKDLGWPKQNPNIRPTLPKIKEVIFNEPATIVIWADGSKTVVKCQEGDTFDPETGLAMAITKKALGNKGNYCDEIKKWLPEEKEEEIKVHSKAWTAYQRLLSAMDDKKATKADLKFAMEEAVGYLGEVLD